MSWWWLIIYDKYNLQRLGSNVQFETKNALVKINSVATLNSTLAHFVIVPQKVITYCCKNIHPQVHLVIQYRHHMLIYLDSLNKCLYIHTQESWFSLKTLDSVLGKNNMFLKASALNGTEPSLTRIKSYHFVFLTHMHLIYTLKHNIDKNVYVFISQFLIKFFLSWQENNIPTYIT
jgi:hypothetical protein